MPIVQSVNADVEIEDVSFDPISIETNVTSSWTSNNATVKGYVNDESLLERNQVVSIYVNDSLIFSGRIKRATQDSEGIITIESYDRWVDIHNKTVTLHTEEPRQLTVIAVDLFSDAFGADTVAPLASDPDTLPPDSIYVEQGDNFPGGEVWAKKSWGSGSSGESFTNVLIEIANGMGGVLWTDARGVLRLEPYPGYTTWTAENIIEAEVSSDINESSEVTEVEVASGSGAIGNNPAQAYVYSRVSGYGRAQIRRDDDTDEGETVTIHDNNIDTQREANARATSELVNERLKAHNGELTTVGDTGPRPWDKMRVPQNDRLPLAEGTYTVASVSHTIDVNDGWKTTFKLVNDIAALTGDMESSGAYAQAVNAIIQQNEREAALMQINR